MAGDGAGGRRPLTAGVDPADPDLGRQRPQRSLPLRLGQEVQALPRPGLIRMPLPEEAVGAFFTSAAALAASDATEMQRHARR